MADFGNTPAPDTDTTTAPGAPPELTLEGGYSIVFIIFFIVLNVSGAASSIAALGITAMLFYFFGVISERQLWEGFGNGGIINLASLAVMVAALGNVPLVKRIAVYFFGGQKGHRSWQLTKILIISYIVALLLPNANQVQLFTPLIRTACIETGMNVQFPLMAMCIVANIANGFAISSNSNIIVGGLWKAKFGYAPGFFEYAPSNFPAAILTTVFMVFMTPFFYPPEMEDAEGFDEIEDGSGGLAPKPAPKAIEGAGVAAAAPAGATNNNNTTATNHIAVPIQTPQIAAHNHNKKHVKNSVESTQVARNPLNEKYSVLMQVFDTRGLRDSRNHNVSGDEVSDEEDQKDIGDNHDNNNDNRSANNNNNNENSQELGAATHEASGVFSKLRRLGNNIQSFGLSVAHGGNADHSTGKNTKNENKKSNKNKKHTPGLQCIVGRKESEALAFIPQELLSRLQLKWLDRSIFDVSEGGKNDDDMTITADSYDTQSSDHQAPSPNQKKGAAGAAASPGTLSPKAVPPLAPPQRSASAAVAVKPKQQPVLDADDLEHHKAASGFHFARHRRQESSYSDTDEGKKKSSHQQEMVVSPPSKPQLQQQQQQQGPNDENNNHDDDQHEVPATPGRNHHHHHHHSRTRSGTMPPKIISSQELAPDSEKFEKVGHVTITTTTTTKTVNGKVVVVNESKEHLESEKVIEKDDIVSVRGTIKDLRTFRSLLALSWVGVADVGRSRIVFQQQHQIKKAEADRRRATEKMKISFKDFDMEMKPTASHNKPQQQQGTKPETAVFPAAPLASVGNPSNNNNNNNNTADSKQPTVPSAIDANNNNNTQHATDDADAEVVSRRVSTQDLAEGEIPLPAHTPLTSEALARIAQDPEHSSHHISRHQSDDEEDTMSDDVVGQFKNSSICYLRHASGARYNVKACALYHGLDAFQPASPESVANTHVFVAVVSGDNPALGQRLENRIFVDTFGCQILACRSFNAGKNLLGRELAWHRLEAGDTLVVRVRPKSAYLWQSNRAQRAFYDIIAQPGSSLLTTAEKDKLMRNYIELPAIIADYFEVGQRSITMRGRVVTLLRLPNWYFNVVPIGIFCFFVASTMLGASVPIMALVCIVLLIWGQIITVHEALQTSDWKLYTSIAFAYAIGEGIAVSGLAQYVGEKIARTGIKGFYAVLACHFLTGFVSCLVGNQGTPTCLFPIAMRMMRIVGIDQLVGLVIVANASASGFMTTFGLPSNLVILTPGRYTPKDFVVFGTPVFIVYGLLSAFFTTWQFGLF